MEVVEADMDGLASPAHEASVICLVYCHDSLGLLVQQVHLVLELLDLRLLALQSHNSYCQIALTIGTH